MKWGTPPFHAYRGGSLVTVKNKTNEMRITMPGNGEIPAVLVGSAEAVTIPRSVPEVQDVHTLVSWFPFQLNAIYRELGGRVAKGELDDSQPRKTLNRGSRPRGGSQPSKLPLRKHIEPKTII